MNQEIRSMVAKHLRELADALDAEAAHVTEVQREPDGEQSHSNGMRWAEREVTQFNVIGASPGLLSVEATVRLTRALKPMIRFSRRISLGSGLRLNVSRSGLGASLGRPGERFGFGPRGGQATLSLPGTGLSWSRMGGIGLGWVVAIGVFVAAIAVLGR